MNLVVGSGGWFRRVPVYLSLGFGGRFQRVLVCLAVGSAIFGGKTHFYGWSNDGFRIAQYICTLLRLGIPPKLILVFFG